MHFLLKISYWRVHDRWKLFFSTINIAWAQNDGEAISTVKQKK